jgi:hypothetical protein
MKLQFIINENSRVPGITYTRSVSNAKFVVEQKDVPLPREGMAVVLLLMRTVKLAANPLCVEMIPDCI